MIGIIKIGISFLNLIYFFFKLLPVKNRVVMISRQSNEPSIEFEMLKKSIEERDSNIQVITLCKTIGRSVDSFDFKMILGNLSYGFHIFKQMYYLATSKVVILDGYCMTVSFLKHKKTLKVVQMWHSMGTMKLFGWGILDQKEGNSRKVAEAMHMHENYDYFFASSSEYVSHLARGFNCSKSKAKIFPLPRYDILKSKDYKKNIRKNIFDNYPEMKTKKNIVYCPTFRKDEEQMSNAINKLASNIPSGFNLIIKLHPLSKVEGYGDNCIVDKKFSSFDMLFIADYVISDYSCIVYEAAVLGIPLAFYNFDFDNYENIRGLAIDYEKELPGIISKDAKEIMEAIRYDKINKEDVKVFADKYIKPTNNATSDITDFIIGLL